MIRLRRVMKRQRASGAEFRKQRKLREAEAQKQAVSLEKFFRNEKTTSSIGHRDESEPERPVSNKDCENREIAQSSNKLPSSDNNESNEIVVLGESPKFPGGSVCDQLELDSKQRQIGVDRVRLESVHPGSAVPSSESPEREIDGSCAGNSASLGGSDWHTAEDHTEPSSCLNRHASAGSHEYSNIHSSSSNDELGHLGGSFLDDVGLWPNNVTQETRTLLVGRGSSAVQNLDYDFGKITRSNEGRLKVRSLSRDWFFRTLKNREEVLRDWLVYSPAKMALSCFPCKLFNADS